MCLQWQNYCTCWLPGLACGRTGSQILKNWFLYFQIVFLDMLAAGLLGMTIQSSESVHHYGPDSNILTTIGLIAITFCTYIHGRQRMIPTLMNPWIFFFPQQDNIFTYTLKYLKGLAPKFWDIHGSQRMNPTNFGDPLTFSVAPPQGSHLWVFWQLSEQRFEGLMDFHENCLLSIIPRG